MTSNHASQRQTGESEAAAHALDAVQLTRSFDDVLAVDHLTFHVAPGELYGLVGPDGAGKTTTLRMLTGLIEPDDGQARVMTADVTRESSAVREKIGYMPQHYSLYGDLSVDENLTFFGQLFGLPRKQLASRKARLLQITRLDRFTDRRAEQLSGGMYKKLALACALLHQPQVLVLDEPSNGVDPVSRRDLWDLLYEFVEEGMAVLLTTPDMDEASRCHRVGLLDRGSLLAEGPPQTLVRQFPHATFLLRSSDRDATEDQLHDHPGVLALSPHGAALRVVVDHAAQAEFAELVATLKPAVKAERVAPNFEDVFLGLVANRERADNPGGAP